MSTLHNFRVGLDEREENKSAARVQRLNLLADHRKYAYSPHLVSGMQPCGQRPVHALNCPHHHDHHCGSLRDITLMNSFPSYPKTPVVSEATSKVHFDLPSHSVRSPPFKRVNYDIDRNERTMTTWSDTYEARSALRWKWLPLLSSSRQLRLTGALRLYNPSAGWFRIRV